MEERLKDLKLFLDFYFAPWGAAKGEVWETVVNRPFSPANATAFAARLLIHGETLTPRARRAIQIVVGQ